MKYLIYIISFILFLIFKHKISSNLILAISMGFYAVIVFFITYDFNRLLTVYSIGEKIKILNESYKNVILGMLKKYNGTAEEKKAIKKALE